MPQHGDDDHDLFMRDVGVLVGARTYEWVLGETNMLAEPHQWQQYYGARPMFVFTSRDLPQPTGADVRTVHGSVRDGRRRMSDCRSQRHGR